MLMKPLSTLRQAVVESRRTDLRFPSPRDATSAAYWTGKGFCVGTDFERILCYEVASSGWTEELTELHEGVDDEDHYMSVASREQAVSSLEYWLKTPNP